jgi:hypothetical protein
MPVPLPMKKAWLDYPTRASALEPVRRSVAGEGSTHGFVLFGRPGSGRSEALNEFGRRTNPLKCQLVRIDLTGGCPTIVAPGVIDRAIDIAAVTGEVLTQADSVAKFTGLPEAQYAKVAGTSLKQIAKLARRQRARAWPGAIQPAQALELVLGLSSKPLVVLIDDLDEADLEDWWWFHFVIPLAGRFADQQRGVLVAAVEDPVSPIGFG